MSDSMRTKNGTFSSSVQRLLRSSGHTQKELADTIPLNHKVLSRKLNGNGQAHLNHFEIRKILTTLAVWHTITLQEEILNLLELAHVEPGIFSSEEWNEAPLNQLQKGRKHTSTASIADENDDVPAPLLHNIPAMNTRFIGREWAVERLLKLFSQHDVRLISLVGLGGSGKTRLAIHVAQELVSVFEHGVWFVSLAGVKDPALVPVSIAQALNIKPKADVPILESLCNFLRKKHILLVLDNFEQVGAAVNVIDEMLAAAPDLHVLVTSRSVLHLYGEHPLAIPPLDLPEPTFTLKASELIHYEAIQLFVEHVQRFVPSFTLNDENKDVIAQICAKVDGLPLALELAAARMRVLTPEQLLERLTDARLAVLTGGAKNLPARQRTLRNTIIWSYDLLSPEEKLWFPRFGIFRGGWSLEAAEAMIPQSDEAVFMLDLIEQLVDDSLFARMPSINKTSRFTMLETLREYARELLLSQYEMAQWQDWHACYYLQLAEEAELGLRGPQQMRWLEKLTCERDNFRIVLEWLLRRARDGMSIQIPASLEREMSGERRRVGGSRTLSSHAAPTTGRLALEVCLRLASALRPYWEWQGYLTEARHWLRDVLTISLKEEEMEETILAARAKALSEMSRLLCLQNEQGQAVALVAESLDLWRQLDDEVGIATALLHRGWIAQAVSDNEEANRVYEEGVRVLDNTDETWLRAQLLCYVAAAAGFTFDFDRMRSFYEKGKRLFEQLGDNCALADFLKDQGGLLILDSKYSEAVIYLVKSISLCKELDQKQYITSGMGWLAIAIGMRGEPDAETASRHTAMLKGALHSLMERVGITPWTDTHPMLQAINLHIRSQIDEESWQQAWEEGRKLNTEQAIALALKSGGGEV